MLKLLILSLTLFGLFLHVRLYGSFGKQKMKRFFNKKIRGLTKFTRKLTHFSIMSQVSLSLEISMVQFMTLVRDVMLLIHKDEVKDFQYLDQFKDMMDPNDIKKIKRKS